MDFDYNSEEVLSLFRQLNVDLNSIKQVEDIMNKFDYRRIIGSLVVKKGSVFLRARPNGKEGIFNTIEQLSYPSPEFCTKHQRANLRGNPVFYCGMQIPGDGKIYDALAGLFFEASDFARQGKGGRVCITYSAWEATNDFKVFYFPFDHTTYRNCPEEISELNRKNCRDYYASFRSNILDDSLLKFLVDKISSTSKNEYDYYIVANVIHYILANSNYFDGIMYLSTRMNGATVNLALTPYAVDNYLTFKEAYIYGFEICNGNIKSFPIACGRFDEGIIKYQKNKLCK